MKLLATTLACSLLLAFSSCAPNVAVKSGTVTTVAAAVTEEDLAAAHIPVPEDKKVLRTLSANLDGDPEEEQLIFLQTKSNLSLPIVLEVADFDIQRKTYYLAWEGELIASASQPFDARVESLIAPTQQELSVRGVAENGRPSLDIFRLVNPGSGLGLQYTTIFSQTSQGNLDLDRTAQGFTSVPVVVEEPDTTSKNLLDTVRTTWEWRFQKGQYEIARVERYRREKQPDSQLEKLFAGDNTTLETFLQGPWVKTAVEKKETPLLLLFDTAHRELVFANLTAQEVYHWEPSTRTLRNGLYITGKNDLISLIRLQMSVTIESNDSVEVTAQDNPNWSGTYTRLAESAALALTKPSTVAETPPKVPKGLYRNDKGDEFDFQFPEVRLVLGGKTYNGAGAIDLFGSTAVLQVKVPGIDGRPVLSKAYSLAQSEESTTSRIVRTIRLQEGRLTIQGWEADSSDALRLEQVEVQSAGVNR